MFKFTIRDVLWLMVVVGLAIVAYVERCRSARLRLELYASEVKIWEEEDRFAELAITVQDYSPAKVRIADGEIEITKEGSPFFGGSWKKLSSGEARRLRGYQTVRDNTKQHAMAYKQAHEANEAKMKAVAEPTNDPN